jgi:DNA-binding FrmR family transcriptional regulator
LTAIADLTDDGQSPDVGLCLERLAQRMHLDEQLAAPLAALAKEMSHWRTLVEHSRSCVEGAGELGRAYRRKRWLRRGAIAAVALAVLSVGFWLGRRELSRHRVRAALEAGGCAVESVGHGDLGRAGSALAAEVERARHACDAERARLERETEERRRGEERAAEEEKRNKALSRACDRLARDVEDNDVHGAYDGALGGQAALIRRVATGTLLPEDIAGELGELKCNGTEGGRRIGVAFVRAAVGSAAGWMLAAAPSASVQKLFAAHKAAVSNEALGLFDGHIEKCADRAVVSGKEEDLGRSIALCELKQALGLALRAHCQAAVELR